MDKIDKQSISKNLLMVRMAQMMINEMYKQKQFKVPIHLALGHEAIAVAVDHVAQTYDKLVLTHRNVHYNLAREKRLQPEIDEYLLNTNGLAEGTLGSMNLANSKKGVLYTSSILGNNLSVAVGIALANSVKKLNAATFVVTGDGAMEEGIFYR